MDFYRQTITIQVSAPVDDGEPSGWDFADLFDLDGDCVQVLNQSDVEELTLDEEDDALITCKECGYILRRDDKGTWIDLTDGDVCYDDVQHAPLTF